MVRGMKLFYSLSTMITHYRKTLDLLKTSLKKFKLCVATHAVTPAFGKLRHEAYQVQSHSWMQSEVQDTQEYIW